MRALLALMAACAAFAGAAHAQTTGRAMGLSFKFTALAVGGDNFKTVYYGKGIAAAVEVCTTDKPVHVRAYSGDVVNVSTITSANECTVVAAEKVTVAPYEAQQQSATANITILGVAGIYNPNP